MPDCLFCSVVAGTVRVHMVVETPAVVAFLDRSPVVKGHVLVVPRSHIVTIADLPPDLVGAYFADVRRVAVAVQAGLGAGGSLVAINNTIGQSVPHLHTHVVPRSRRDGLRGLLWPRTRYASADEAAEYAARIAAALPDA